MAPASLRSRMVGSQAAVQASNEETAWNKICVSLVSTRIVLNDTTNWKLGVHLTSANMVILLSQWLCQVWISFVCNDLLLTFTGTRPSFHCLWFWTDQWTLGQKSSTQMSVLLTAGPWCGSLFSSHVFPLGLDFTSSMEEAGSFSPLEASLALHLLERSKEHDGGRRVVFLRPWESLSSCRRLQYNLESPARQTKPTQERHRRYHSGGYYILSPPGGK